MRQQMKFLLFVLILAVVGGAAFAAGLAYADGPRGGATAGMKDGAKPPRIVYPEKTELDFEGLQIQGEVRNPGEFYFQHRTEEKFDSLVRRRKNFHREMLRDAVLSK